MPIIALDTKILDQLQELVSTICNHADALEELFAEDRHAELASHLGIIFEDACAAKSCALTLARVVHLNSIAQES